MQALGPFDRALLLLHLWLTRPDVVLGNLGAGVLMAVVAALLMRRYPDSFDKDATSRSLREAEAELAELAGLS